MADSSLKYDRETKGPLYASSRVPEYWLVDVAGAAIEVHSNPIEGRYTQVRRLGVGDVVRIAAFPDVVLTIADFVD